MLFDTPRISRCRSQHVSVEPSSLFHHSIYLWFICFPWWSIDELENLHTARTTVCFKPWQKPRARLGIRKTGLSPPPSILILTIPRRYFCCGSLLLLVLAVRIYTLIQLLCWWHILWILGSWMTTCLGKSCSFGLPRVSFVNCCQFMYLVIFLLVLRAGCWIWLYLCLSFYLELQPFIPNASRLSIWQFNNLSHR